MDLTIISVPYAAGRLEEGMGKGPSRYLAAGADERLRKLGHDVDVASVHAPVDDAQDEPEAAARIAAALAAAVAQASDSGRFPLVLAGNCNSCLGTLAGLRVASTGAATELGIVWFDAHGDLNTPETTPSGFFDGMGLAIATGRCLPELREKAALLRPVSEAAVLHLGSRDLDPPELDCLERAPMLSLSAAQMQEGPPGEALVAALSTLRARVADVYLHVDIDVLAGEFAPGVDFPSPGGLTRAELEDAIRHVAGRFTIRAAALTAYDPDHERDDLTLRSGLRLMEVIAGEV